jgi:hypothetical protein
VILATATLPTFPEFAKPPEFKVHPEVEIKEAGATATFECSGKVNEGEDEPDITWYENR